MSSSLESVLRAKAEYILSEDRIEEWETLRESMQDSALTSASRDVYVANMQAAYLQLLGGALMKALGGPAALMQDVVGVMRLYNIIEETVQKQGSSKNRSELKTAYNRAYGSTPDNVAVPMAEVFNRLVANGLLSKSSVNQIVQHLTAIWSSFIAELGRASGRSGG